MITAPRTLFVGVGSSHGDDQIGWRIADELLALPSPLANVIIRKAAVPLDLLDWLDHVTALHVCDACDDRLTPGTLHSWQHDCSSDKSLEILRAGGSHDFGLPAVLQLATRLGQLPNPVVIHAVTGRCFEPGEALSDEILREVSSITHTISQQLAGGVRVQE